MKTGNRNWPLSTRDYILPISSGIIISWLIIPEGRIRSPIRMEPWGIIWNLIQAFYLPPGHNFANIMPGGFFAEQIDNNSKYLFF
jgi:hypothetical protein